MVCLGNICRSPLAEGILKQISENQMLKWQVDSAGTGSWHVGEAPDHRSIKAAKDIGYDISKQRARHFKPQMFETYDHILVMDKHNYRDVISMAPSPHLEEKVQLFLPNAEVTDPYYENALFAPVAAQIEQRCKELVQELQNN